MPKILSSPSKRWPGSVTIADPLTLPQVEPIEEALEYKPEGAQVRLTVLDKNRLPAVLACVEKWELEGFPAAVTMETFPLSPRPESSKLIGWIWNEILKIYLGDLEVPNE